MGEKEHPEAAASHARVRAALGDAAAFGLARQMPSLSAHRVITNGQVAALIAIALATVAASIVWPRTVASALIALTSFAFVAGTVFRTGLALLGGLPKALPQPAAEAEMPLYTVLVPLYREANVLPQLVRSLRRLDYPRERLDIKLIVEEDDAQTGHVAERLRRYGPFEVVRVPEIGPRTKPKACNFALHFARGEFVVIYDAEDRPDRDQLRKAVAAFRARGEELACLQARLNFYNADENWLTRGIIAQTPLTA